MWERLPRFLSLLRASASRTAKFNFKERHFHQVQYFCTRVSPGKESEGASFNALLTNVHRLVYP